jgi:hypothetical protein
MNKERKNLLVFGYGLALILGIIAARIWMTKGLNPLIGALLVLAAGLAVATAINILWIKPIYTGWMAVVRPIGHAMSLIILTGLFYGVFGVVGIILRLLKKDLLKETIDPGAQTYWIKRALQTDLQRYTKQY